MSVKHNLEQWISEIDSDGMCDISDNQVIYLVRGYAALEAKCAALAAENAEMRSSIDATIGWQESTDPENGESVRMLVDIKTPATDTFLAEVRAQGVDASIEHLSKKFEGTGHIGVPVMALEWLAKEIRKGAAQ